MDIRYRQMVDVRNMDIHLILGYILWFLNHLRVGCRHHAPYPLILQYIFPKNEDILLHNHSTAMKFRTLSIDMIL